MCNWRGSRPRELGGDKFGRPFVGLKTVSQMESNGQRIDWLTVEIRVKMDIFAQLSRHGTHGVLLS
jgi:hypothetical protein